MHFPSPLAGEGAARRRMRARDRKPADIPLSVARFGKQEGPLGGVSIPLISLLIH